MPPLPKIMFWILLTTVFLIPVTVSEIDLTQTGEGIFWSVATPPLVLISCVLRTHPKKSLAIFGLSLSLVLSAGVLWLTSEIYLDYSSSAGLGYYALWLILGGINSLVAIVLGIAAFIFRKPLHQEMSTDKFVPSPLASSPMRDNPKANS